jgi:hypothetical protein
MVLAHIHTLVADLRLVEYTDINTHAHTGGTTPDANARARGISRSVHTRSVSSASICFTKAVFSIGSVSKGDPCPVPSANAAYFQALQALCPRLPLSPLVILSVLAAPPLHKNSAAPIPPHTQHAAPTPPHTKLHVYLLASPMGRARQPGQREVIEG